MKRIPQAALISLIISIFFVVLLNIYILFIEKYLPLYIVNMLSNIYLLPFIIGTWVSGNVHQPSSWGFNGSLFLIFFILNFTIVLFCNRKNK